LNPEPFNTLANNPCIRPWIGGTEPLDLTALVLDPENYCFLTDCHQGGYVVRKIHLGLYECHSLALESARGKPMLRLMRDGFRYLFCATPCIEVVTTCPDGNPAASRWADLAGFREAFRREGSFNMGGQMVGASYRSLTYADWVFKDVRNRKDGEVFHEVLEAVRPHSHPDDPAHDYYVGATVEGCRRGNIEKAVMWYNRWAAHAGYMQARIVSVTPPVLDIGDAIVHLVDDQPSVLRLI
jgi:hypothetical protein